MADDRTIAPAPSRWHRAWRAGLRPWSPWLLPAVACGLLALAVDVLSATGGAPPWLDPRPGAVTPGSWLAVTAGWLASGLAVAGLLVVAVSLLSQRLGVVSAIEERRLGAAPPHPVVLARLVLCLAVGVGVALALVGMLAGAARSVDASERGLGTLCLSWAGQAGTALCVGLLVAAVLELWLDRLDRGARLRQSPQQLRDDARAEGGRSR